MTVSMIKERASGSVRPVSLVKRRGTVTRALRLELPGSSRRRSVDVVELSDGTTYIVTRYRPGVPHRSGFRRIGADMPWSKVRSGLAFWETVTSVAAREDARHTRPTPRALAW